MSVLDILNVIDEYLWYIALILVVCLGVYSTVRLKGIQFRNLREMVRVTFSKEERSDKGKLSSFQVFCISMGNRIGVGNIAGPILAILIGGPGAILWMWVFALLGMATCFLETTIGQIYKDRKDDGTYRGGPAYNVSKGLGMKRMGTIVAFVMIMMYIVGFVSMEITSMSEAICGAFVFDNNNLVFAVIITLVAALILAGGIRRVADLSVRIVPAMAVLWLVVCIVSIALSNEGVVHAVSSIFAYAFTLPSCIGGGIGAMLTIGMKRGVLSNEAGIGTIPNISSMADVAHPARQGLSQSLGVLIDTVVSTLTALVILSYADIDEIISLGLESMPLLQLVFADAFGGFASYMVALFLFVFALTSMMSDFVIGENNLVFIKDGRTTLTLMRVTLLLVVFVSSFMASDEMFAVVDIMLGICALINAVVMFRLAGRALEAYRDYREQKESGIADPVFDRGVLSDARGITEWGE